MTKNRHIILDIWTFIRVNRRWWLLPLLVLLLIFGTIIVLGEMTALSPFIYAMF